MPDAPRSAPLAFHGIDDIVAALRERGGRFSPGRRAVLEALFAAEEPASAESLAGGLGGRTSQVELSSVYRFLEQLERLGVVRHVHFGHGPGLYALTGPREREYLMCDGCGRVRTVAAGELDPVRDLVRALSGFEVRFTHFPMVGLCAACAAAKQGEPGRVQSDSGDG